jgi:hypothetical protein
MRHGGPITFFGKAVEIKSHLKLGATQTPTSTSLSLDYAQSQILLSSLTQVVRARPVRLELTPWARHLGYKPAAHHRLIISWLQAEGSTERLA